MLSYETKFKLQTQNGRRFPDFYPRSWHVDKFPVICPVFGRYKDRTLKFLDKRNPEHAFNHYQIDDLHIFNLPSTTGLTDKCCARKVPCICGYLRPPCISFTNSKK